MNKVVVLENLLSQYKCPELCSVVLQKTHALLSLLFVSDMDREVRFVPYNNDHNDAVETGLLIYRQFESVCETFCDFNPEVFNMVHAFIEKSMELYHSPSEHYGLKETIQKFGWSMDNVVSTLKIALDDSEALGVWPSRL